MIVVTSETIANKKIVKTLGIVRGNTVPASGPRSVSTATSREAALNGPAEMARASTKTVPSFMKHPR